MYFHRQNLLRLSILVIFCLMASPLWGCFKDNPPTKSITAVAMDPDNDPNAITAALLVSPQTGINLIPATPKDAEHFVNEPRNISSKKDRKAARSPVTSLSNTQTFLGSIAMTTSWRLAWSGSLRNSDSPPKWLPDDKETRYLLF